MPIIGISPEEDIEKQRKKRVILLTMVLILLVIIIAGLWYWLYYLEAGLRNQIANLESKIKGVEAQIEEKKTLREEALTLQRQLSNLEALIENHIYWSKTFEEIEESTLKKAYFTRFTGDAAGKKITLSCQVPDFTQAAKQLSIFKENKKFTEVNVSSLSMGAEEGKSYLSFDVTLTLTDDLLMPYLK